MFGMFGYFDEWEEPSCGFSSFDSATRKHLYRLLTTAWKKANPDKEPALASAFADRIIRDLPSFAFPNVLVEEKLEYRFTDKGRREKIAAVANAFEHLEKAMQQAEMFDLAFALEHGLSKVKASGADIDPNTLAWRYAKQTRRDRNGDPHQGDLHVMATELREYALTYPFRGYRSNNRLAFAIDIARELTSHGIPVTTSSTGVAGTLFEAAYDLANIPTPKASYWLKKAKQQLEAESGLVQKMELGGS